MVQNSSKTYHSYEDGKSVAIFFSVLWVAPLPLHDMTVSGKASDDDAGDASVGIYWTTDVWA